MTGASSTSQREDGNAFATQFEGANTMGVRFEADLM